jgi:hypothetical protein
MTIYSKEIKTTRRRDENTMKENRLYNLERGLQREKR